MAWVTDAPEVNVVRGWHRRFWGLGRVWHELEHLLAPDFRRNEDHAPWWSFSVRCGHALRLRRGRLVVPRDVARNLQGRGYVLVDPAQYPGSQIAAWAREVKRRAA